MFQTKVQTKPKNTLYVQYCCPTFGRLSDIVKELGRSAKATDQNMGFAHCMLET